MTKTLLFSIFSSGLFSITIGQTSNLILTNEQNKIWLDSLSTLSFDNKLRMINDRVLSDTNVFIMRYYPDGIKASDYFANSQTGNRVSGAGKPLLMLTKPD